MADAKEIRLIEEDCCSTVEHLYDMIEKQDYHSYKSGLIILEELNKEYKTLTGGYCIRQEIIVGFHEKLWSKFA